LKDVLRILGIARYAVGGSVHQPVIFIKDPFEVLRY